MEYEYQYVYNINMKRGNMKFNGYINGEKIDTGRYLEIVSPLDNKVIGSVQSLTTKEINLAFESANIAFKDWRKETLQTRVKYIEEFKDALFDNKEELAEIMHLETGKRISDSITEIVRTIEYIDQTIDEWENVKYETIVHGSKKANIHRIPLGVVLAISPFNYPVNLSLAKIIPALLIGNTVVFKPATNGSLVGSFIANLFAEINLPKGVFNLVTGRGREIGDEIVENNLINMISFTGSERVGKQIASKKKMIPLVLELGGNDAAYIREDADIENAVKEVVKGAFSYAGQRCTAIKRVIVHKNISKYFIDELKEEVSKLEMEPLITVAAAEYVMGLISDSETRGDEFILKGECKDNIIPPHIVLTTKDSRAFKEEAFGPLLPIVVIENEDNVIDLINDTNFGLQNSIFTKDIEWVKNNSLFIESGTVNINRSSSRGPDIFPFSGIKDSGFGTQGIKEALLSMSRMINVVEND